MALVGGLGLACASTGTPHAEPAALAAAPAADPAVIPDTPASAALDEASAANAAPDAAAAVPGASTAASATDEGADFDYELDVAEPDPFEPMNRGVFRFNEGLDHVLVGPVARGYAWLVPAPGRRAVRRVFENLDAPVVVVNSVLQLELRHAAVATVRFVLNSTVGFAGLFDPAQEVGLAPVEADFGQTLGRIGIGTGPYLVLPVFGPTTARDGIGTLVDSFLRPQTYLLTFAEGLVLASGNGITMRDEEGPALQALEDSSVDFYAALRSAYFMHRQALVEGSGDPPGDPEAAPATAAAQPAAVAPSPVVPESAEPGAPLASRVGATAPIAPDAGAARVLPAAPAP